MDDLITAAESGDAESQYELAMEFFRGEGRKQNRRSAAKWFRRAAEQGHPEATGYLGWSYLKGLGLKQNNQKAEALIREAANSGVGWAQYQLGVMYRFGNGVDENDEEAANWFTLAANQGYAEAQYFLGMSYRYGQGVDEDPEESFHWLSESSKNGDLDATYELAWAYFDGMGGTEDRKEGIRLLREAAKLGHPYAQLALGIKYLSGRDIKKRGDLAFHWIEKSALQGNEEAQFRLGRIFMGDSGVKPEDREEAFGWIQKAAENGFPEALYRLAHFYFDGYGVEEDFEAGLRLLCEAAKLDSAAAQHEFAWRLIPNIEANADLGEIAFHWLSKACEQDYPPALIALSMYYAVGMISPDGAILADSDESLSQPEKHDELIGRAAELGNPSAQTYMGMKAVNTNAFRDAESWLIKAVEQGDPLGMSTLASLYLSDDYCTQHHGQAIELLGELASLGSPLGGVVHAKAGVFFAEGRLVSQDHVRAVSCFARSATRDEVIGKLLLADAFEFGRGVPQDAQKSDIWYREAASAFEALGEDEVAAFKSGENDDLLFPGLGALIHAMCVRRQLKEKPNQGNLLELLEEARFTGLALVDYHIGRLIEAEDPNNGISEDALDAYRRAAERGHREAQYQLACALLESQPSPGIAAEAISLLEAAGNQGLTSALCKLGMCFLDGKHVPIDPEVAQKLLQDAAERGDVRAQFVLGKALFDGHGVVQDAAEAYVWLNLAAAHQYEGAVELREAAAKSIPKGHLGKSQSRATALFRHIVDERNKTQMEFEATLAEAEPSGE